MSDHDDWTAKTIAEFRANRGKVGGRTIPVLALHRAQHPSLRRRTSAATGDSRRDRGFWPRPEPSSSVWTRIPGLGGRISGIDGRTPSFGADPRQPSRRNTWRGSGPTRSVAIVCASASGRRPVATRVASQPASIRLATSWRAGMDRNARVSSMKPLVL